MIRPSSPAATGWLLLSVLSLLLATSVPARAQPPEEPIGGYVVDLRGSFVPFARNVELAENRGLLPQETPGRGFGYDVGGHVYLLRLWQVTFGLGGSYHASTADQQTGDPAADLPGPTFRKRFSALSSQLSFNFGHRNGWSYLSGGLGTSRLSLFRVDPAESGAEPRQESANTLNYGGGVRWFLNPRLAFTIDIRFYAISPLPAAGEAPGSPRMTQTTFNVGASFR